MKISQRTIDAFVQATPPKDVYEMARQIVGRELTVPEFMKVLANFYSAPGRP
jgi:hypothetical protein